MKRNVQLIAVKQAVNGLAEMYAELSAKCTALEGKVAYLTKQASSRPTQYWASDMMDEYFNGKEGEDE